MRAVVQRVEKALVSVEGDFSRSISEGLVVFLAVARDDTPDDLAFVKRKILNLRIFNDSEGKMNRSLLDVAAEVLIVSQFTLYGDCRKGNRPSYSRAASPDYAEQFYRQLIEEIRSEGVSVKTGQFQAMMKVELINDGPVTLIIDSKKDVY